ncbi:hypothetical protein [Actinacidiphila sp. bgisy145]|uniref:hypothetical protein n=1 Tax=Actinacidiphila sp. bgisy145 TaxID=3413792 RepID=UPI003EBF90DD
MRGTGSGTGADAVRGIIAAAVGTASGMGDGPGGGGAGGLARVRPARAAAARIAAGGGVDEHAAEELRAAVEAHLAGDTGRWLRMYDALPSYRGSLPELLAEPEPLVPPAPDSGLRAPAPRSVDETFALAVAHARPAHAAAVLAALPDRALERLLSGGTLPAPALVRAVTEHGDTRSRTALARHSRLDPRVLARLLGTGDAAVGAAVYRNPRTTHSLRRTLARRLDAVPMDPALRAELADPAADVPRTWLAPLLCSGEPDLVARALGAGARGAAQRYALARVWERHGPGALRTLLADPALARSVARPVRAAVSAALAAAEQDAGGGAGEGTEGAADRALRGLYERGEPYGDPARLPALLAAARGTSTLRDLLAEPYAHDLDALHRAHLAHPFMPKACEELARHEAASDEQRRSFRLSVLNEPWRAGGRRGGNLTAPEARLTAEELDGGAVSWAEGVVAAGLLDPVALVRTARPAERALAALGALRERGLLSADAAGEVRDAAAKHLRESAAGWAEFDRLLPEFTGTLRELVEAAGAAAAAGAPDGPGPSEAPAESGGAAQAETRGPEQERYEPPLVPRRPTERAALCALDLLRSLAPADAPAPDPADPGVLRFLAATEAERTPGLATPLWLLRACAAQGVEPPAHGSWYAAPTAAEVRAKPPETWGSGAARTELAYTQGILTADDLLGWLPAHRLLLLPYDWRRLAFPAAWRAALARRLHAEFGTDPDAWLHLAAVARHASPEDTWLDLLARATASLPSSRAAGEPADGRPGRNTPGTTASEDAVITPPHAGATGVGSGRAAAVHAPAGGRMAAEPADRPSWDRHSVRPRTPDDALGLLAHGDHLWVWPIGTLLCLAGADTVDAVLPRLGPDGPWSLAAYLLRYDRTPRPAYERLLAGRDPRALRVLGTQQRRLSDGLAARLAEVDDPGTDLVLLRHTRDPLVVDRIVARSARRSAAPGGDGKGAQSADPVAAGVLASLRADPKAGPPGGMVWLGAPVPDLVEELLTRYGTELDFVRQVRGCLSLLEHGGAARLTSLAARGALGRAATRLCVKALAAPDPAAVLRARVARELAPAKLVKKLRGASHRWVATSLVARHPGPVDWQALEAAHQEEPLPHWEDLIGMGPLELRLRHPHMLPEPGPDGLPDGAAATLARARHGLAGHYHCAAATQIDGLLASGLLTAADLLHEAAPAALLLDYLGSAARRPDAPPQAAAALAELADLVRSRLGSAPAAWARVDERLTGRDPRWAPQSTVADLLA